MLQRKHEDTDGSVNRSGVLLRLSLSFPGESDGRVVGDHVRSHPRYPVYRRSDTPPHLHVTRK